MNYKPWFILLYMRSAALMCILAAYGATTMPNYPFTQVVMIGLSIASLGQSVAPITRRLNP